MGTLTDEGRVMLTCKAAGHQSPARMLNVTRLSDQTQRSCMGAVTDRMATSDVLVILTQSFSVEERKS